MDEILAGGYVERCQGAQDLDVLSGNSQLLAGLTKRRVGIVLIAIFLSAARKGNLASVMFQGHWARGEDERRPGRCVVQQGQHGGLPRMTIWLDKAVERGRHPHLSLGAG